MISVRISVEFNLLGFAGILESFQELKANSVWVVKWTEGLGEHFTFALVVLRTHLWECPFDHCWSGWHSWQDHCALAQFWKIIWVSSPINVQNMTMRFVLSLLGKILFWDNGDIIIFTNWRNKSVDVERFLNFSASSQALNLHFAKWSGGWARNLFSSDPIDASLISPCVADPRRWLSPVTSLTLISSSSSESS